MEAFVVRGASRGDLASLRERAPTPEDWRALFTVAVEPEAPRASGAPLPMLGTYAIDDEGILFTPRYPLSEGQRYRATFGGVSRVFEVPRASRPPTRVLRVYPSADVLPENLLRFYIYFSAPMRDDEALTHLSLVAEDGEEVQGVFLDLRRELWDATGTRLTVLFDPGRVKTGLRAHEHLGRALVAGQRYRLVVRREWRDAFGDPLAAAFEKSFLVTCEDVEPPTLSSWRLEAPARGTRGPLTIALPKAMDHVLMAAFIRVRDPLGRELGGEIDLSRRETEWIFTPGRHWEAGRHCIEVDSRLEDLAGNNLNGRFDRPPDGGSSPGPPASIEPARLFFEPQ